MSEQALAKVKIYRYNPKVDREPYYDEYDGIPFEGRTVLDVLKYVYEKHDTSLAFRYSCRGGLCNVCLLMLNGKNVMSCKKLAEKEMIIEPAKNKKVIKDLMVDLSEKVEAGV
ncbi:MAG: 2Fe-2S iron-sulfur cluster-binding protein [Bacillota bacterium]